MTKPRLLVGTIGSTTKITDCTSLQAAEMEAMCRIGERYGYEALVAEASPSPKTRAAKFPTGRKVWDGKGSIDTVWLHQQGPNYMGGPSEKVCEAIDFLASGQRNLLFKSSGYPWMLQSPFCIISLYL